MADILSRPQCVNAGLAVIAVWGVQLAMIWILTMSEDRRCSTITNAPE